MNPNLALTIIKIRAQADFSVSSLILYSNPNPRSTMRSHPQPKGYVTATKSCLCKIRTDETSKVELSREIENFLQGDRRWSTGSIVQRDSDGRHTIAAARQHFVEEATCQCMHLASGSVTLERLLNEALWLNLFGSYRISNWKFDFERTCSSCVKHETVVCIEWYLFSEMPTEILFICFWMCANGLLYAWLIWRLVSQGEAHCGPRKCDAKHVRCSCDKLQQPLRLSTERQPEVLSKR